MEKWVLGRLRVWEADEGEGEGEGEKVSGSSTPDSLRCLADGFSRLRS